MIASTRPILARYDISTMTELGFLDFGIIMPAEFSKSIRFGLKSGLPQIDTIDFLLSCAT